MVPQTRNKDLGNIMNGGGRNPIATQHGLMEQGKVLLSSSVHQDLIPN